MERTQEMEANFNWAEAAESYKQISRMADSDTQAAEIWEKIGFCFGRASTQADTLEKFRELGQRAVESYDQAARLFENDANTVNLARNKLCRMLSAYLQSWIATSTAEKKMSLDESIELGRSCLVACENLDLKVDYARVCSDLLLILLERLYISSDSEEMRKIAQTGTEYAEKAIAALSKADNKRQLLKAYYAGSLQSWYAANIAEQEERRNELVRRSLDYANNALNLSKEINDPYGSAMSFWAASACTLLFTEKAELSLEYAYGMLKDGTTLRDNYLKGVASYLIAFAANWMTVREEDPIKRRESREKTMKHAEDAVRFLKITCQDYFVAETCLYYAESYSAKARDADPGEKRILLEKAVSIGRLGLEHATLSGSPDARGSTLHALSKALQFMSSLETKTSEKRTLLVEALTYREQYNSIVEKAFSSNDWTRGVGKSYEGLTKAELAKTEAVLDRRKSLLESSLKDMEEGVARCRKTILLRPIPTLITVVGTFEEGLGWILGELYLLTKERENLIKAIGVYDSAASDFRKANMSNRAAEAYWKAAKTSDSLGELERATKYFESAVSEYTEAAKKIPQFSRFYEDYASYMKAWSMIEKAKIEHRHEEYSEAAINYKKASELTSQTRIWKYLATNFNAWSAMEHAEHLSRKETSDESIKAFRRAVMLFLKSKEALERETSNIKDNDEKQKAIELSNASTLKKEYCIARIDVEEARILDLEGDYAQSAEKYGSAASAFEELTEKTQIDSEQEETKAIAFMCRAWQTMKMADRRVTPKLYHEASDLFLKAKEHSTGERTNLLALGNSAFCKALQYGTEFEETREEQEFSKVKKYLESASGYYLRAGFENASEWTNATETLFDAYNYMIGAEIEPEPGEKTKRFLLAEKCLERSSKLYEEAGYTGKKEEILKILGKVKEKREFTLSLKDLVLAPREASNTSAMPAPKMVVEEPVGLMRFERGLIQANLIASKQDIRVGEDLVLEIQLANLGKKPAFLKQIDEIVPDELDVSVSSDTYEIKEDHLNMKGTQLDPLKTLGLTILLKPLGSGSFVTRPRILYTDETGNQMSCEAESITVKVSESMLCGRVPTGYLDLDNLLLGGIPETYAILLTAPSFDERDLLVRNFLEIGARNSETTLYFTIDAHAVKNLGNELPKNFYVFICNPQAGTIIRSLPTVFKLKGVENLTEINIALTSATQGMEPPSQGQRRRACLEIVSDVLLQHRAVIARRWLSALIPELKSKGFTTMAVLNPRMHPSEEAIAIQDLFDGEISMYEKETRKGPEKFLRVKKMFNQKYLDNELPVRKERLQLQK